MNWNHHKIPTGAQPAMIFPAVSSIQERRNEERNSTFFKGRNF